MSMRGKLSVVTTAVVAAALISAPVASARQTCHDAGSHVRCETSGSVAIKAVPQTRAPNVSEITPTGRDRRRGIVWSW